ncbi:hypothetical protein GCM10020219_040970 [Nonomuraea dietziae]
MVAGTVRRRTALLITLAVVAVAGVAGVMLSLVALPIAVVAGLGAAMALLHHARRRLGGVTGDVLGALVETATTAVLVVCAAIG